MFLSTSGVATWLRYNVTVHAHDHIWIYFPKLTYSSISNVYVDHHLVSVMIIELLSDENRVRLLVDWRRCKTLISEPGDVHHKQTTTKSKNNHNKLKHPSSSGEKEIDLTQSYDKSLYISRNVKRAKWQHQQRHKKFDYTAIAGQHRTVSWRNYDHPTGVVNRFKGQHSHSPQQPCNLMTHI